MTVADLIDALRAFPPTMLCVIEYDGQYNDASVKPVIVVKPHERGWGDYRQASMFRSDDENHPAIPAVCVGCGGDC